MLTLRCFIISFAIVCLNAYVFASELQACSADMGCVKGKYMPGMKTEKFIAFLGIPYALPPIRELRFKVAKPYPRFYSVYDATEAKADCIQKNYLLPNPTIQGSEDCLYLNVYKPLNANPKASLPVMVYIFGGGWFSGTSHPAVHGPEYFMDTKEVVFVIFNYRLGPFGFLSTNDNNMPGNLGLKDQNLVLHWVKKNIDAFGGNPNKVTLFGQSAGSISVHMHMLSKQSKGLFQAAISLSGTANVPFAINDRPLEQVRKMAKLCNIYKPEKFSTYKLADTLRYIDAKKLLEAGDGLKYWDVDHMTNFRPIVESAKNRDPFMTVHPDDIIKTKQYTPVPWMISFVPNEGAVRGIAILEQPKLLKEFNKTFDKMLENFLDFPQTWKKDTRAGYMSFVRQSYFKNKNYLDESNKFGLLDVISDRGFMAPMLYTLYSYTHAWDTKTYPVYVFQFAYKGQYSFANLFAGRKPSVDYGVGHCDDLIYLFRMPAIFPDFAQKSGDANVVQEFVGTLVSFAKNLDSKTIQTCTKKDFVRSNGFCYYRKLVNMMGFNAFFEYSSASLLDRSRLTVWNKQYSQKRHLSTENKATSFKFIFKHTIFFSSLFNLLVCRNTV